MNIKTSEYVPAHKPKVLHLFKKTFQREMSEQFFNWRFEQYPLGKPLARVASINEKIVALYLLQPVNLVLNSKVIKALFSMSTMTDPEYAGYGIMSNLANEVYDLGARQGYKLVFGFANKVSRHMFTKKLVFNELKVMKEISPNLSVDENTESNFNCIPINNFDHLYDKFYQHIEDPMKNMVRIDRTSEYLNWRYVCHPEVNYSCYEIKEKNDFLGYFVLKNYKNVKCHLVDFLICNNLDCYKIMLNQARTFCNKNKIGNLTLWVNESLPIFDYLYKRGCTESYVETFFITKMLTNEISYSDVRLGTKWYITMGDSDVF